MFREPQHQGGLGSAHGDPGPPRTVHEDCFRHRGELRLCGRRRYSCCCRRRRCCRCRPCCCSSMSVSSSAGRATRGPRGRVVVDCLSLRRRLARGGLGSSTLRARGRRLLLLLLLLLLLRSCFCRRFGRRFRRRRRRRGLGLLLRFLFLRVALLLHQQRANEDVGRVGRDDLAFWKTFFFSPRGRGSETWFSSLLLAAFTSAGFSALPPN